MQPRWSELTAYFGGAFDPPHLGHREAAQGLLRNPGVKAVRILPSGTPALKAARTPAADRLAMARLGFAGLAGIAIDEREARRASGAPTYTYETLQELRREFGVGGSPDTLPFAFVLGVDQVEALDRWHRFPEVLGLTHWIALERAPEGSDRMEAALARLRADGVLESGPDPRVWRTRQGTTLLRAATPARALSSTEIRRDFARGTPEAGTTTLDPAVLAYAREKRLYG